MVSPGAGRIRGAAPWRQRLRAAISSPAARTRNVVRSRTHGKAGGRVAGVGNDRVPARAGSEVAAWTRSAAGTQLVQSGSGGADYPTNPGGGCGPNAAKF